MLDDDQDTASRLSEPVPGKIWPDDIRHAAPRKRGGRDPAPGTVALTRGRVLEGIIELHAAGRVASRATLAGLLGVNIGRLDEHIKFLYEEGLIRRIVAGVYEPALPVRESRAVTLTKLPTGLVKLEIGDACLELTAQESRATASLLLGSAFDFSLVTSNRDLADQIADLRSQHHHAKDELLRLIAEQIGATRTAGEGANG